MGRRILLAEHNQHLATTLATLLERQGFVVAHHAGGISALKAIAAQPPDLLLLDLRLPGLHGLTLLDKLRQSPRTAQLPVIILGGIEDRERYQVAVKAHYSEVFLAKPFTATDLLAAIGRLLPAGSATVAPAVTRPFAQHLRTAFLKGFSGQLTLSWPDAEHTLTFIDGAPVALQPGFGHRDLGDFLRSRGWISAAEYEYFATAAGGRHASLVQLGCLEHSNLLQAEREYLEQELVAAFGRPAARARWRTFASPVSPPLPGINVPQLFHDGYHKHPDQAGARLPQMLHDKFAAIDHDYFRHINFLALNAAEKQFVHQLDGQRKLSELLAAKGDFGPLLLTLTSLNMIRFSAGLLRPAEPGGLPVRTLFNAVEAELEMAQAETFEHFSDLADTDTALLDAELGAAASAVPGADDLAQEVRLMASSLAGQNHYQVFGIKPAKFSIDRLKERYFAITRKFGPDLMMQLGGADAALVEEILSKTATAYDTLSDVVKKERYDELLGSDRIGLGREGDDRFQAEVQAESGKVFLAMEEWDNAEKALQEAVNFDPNNGDYLACLAWAIYRNPEYATSRALQNKARQMLNKALAMQRTARGCAYKGWMLFEAGQDNMAEAEFSKALKLDARQIMARQGLRAIQEKREQQKKGLFKRMFK